MPIIIKKSLKNKLHPFRVVYTGDNKEVLTNSEPLKTKQSCFKNIMAVAKNFNLLSGTTEVTDSTGKKSVKYRLYVFTGEKEKI